jgi:hypothetical protein
MGLSSLLPGLLFQLERQTVSKTLGGSVTSVSGGVTKEDESKYIPQLLVFNADNGEEFRLVYTTLNSLETMQNTGTKIMQIHVARHGLQ